MAEDRDFADLMRRLQAADEAAAAEVFERFSVALVCLAHERLGRLARGKIDAEDVVQSVFKSFFNRQRQGLVAPEGWGGLWALLTVITLRKCGHHRAYLLAARRDVRREAPPARSSSSLHDLGREAVAPEPTPAQAAILAETVEQLLNGLQPEHRKIVQLALEGYTPAEIAREVDLTVRSVQRILKHVRDKVHGQAADPERDM